jgi:hypothetical protein
MDCHSTSDQLDCRLVTLVQEHVGQSPRDMFQFPDPSVLLK